MSVNINQVNEVVFRNMKLSRDVIRVLICGERAFQTWTEVETTPGVTKAALVILRKHCYLGPIWPRPVSGHRSHPWRLDAKEATGDFRCPSCGAYAATSDPEVWCPAHPNAPQNRPKPIEKKAVVKSGYTKIADAP